MNPKNLLKLIIAIVICQSAGLIGSIFTSPNIASWYANLIKPSFNPPNWLFAPVWTILFLLMGISLFLIWKRGLSKAKMATLFFIIQLVLNVFWSFLFFGLNNPYYALIEIYILLIFIILTIIKFWHRSTLAGTLLIPYALWVSFATILNFSIWRLNL